MTLTEIRVGMQSANNPIKDGRKSGYVKWLASTIVVCTVFTQCNCAHPEKEPQAGEQQQERTNGCDTRAWSCRTSAHAVEKY